MHGTNELRSALVAAWDRMVGVSAHDEEIARLGRLFNTLMVISIGICIALSAMFLALHPLGMSSARVSRLAASFPLVFVPLSIYCIVTAKRLHVRAMVRLYVWLNLAAIAVAAWVFEGIVSPAWLLFAWTITIAGILLSPESALLLTAAAAAYYVFLVVLTMVGIYRPLFSFGPEGHEFTSMGVVLITLVSTVGLLTWLNMRSLRDALGKLRLEVTAHKHTEVHLRESEERYRNVFNNAGDIIFTLSGGGDFITLNPAGERITGWAAQEWLGRSFMPLVPSSELPRAFDILERTLRGEVVGRFELPVKKKDGGYFTGEFTVAPVRQGDSVVVLAICRDITERKQMEAEERKLKEELELKVAQRTEELLAAQEELVRKEKLSLLGQVAGSVGHELRNPLGVISNAVYFLETVLTDADQTTREYLNIIKSEIAGAERIVSDLLDSVRTKPPHPELVQVRTLIDQTLRKYSIPSSVALKLELPEALPLLRVDAPQMTQVFRNLISNAVEAMPNGGELTIGAVENRPARSVTVSVRDTGMGIPGDVQERLFQPLVTTKARGIGLGLVVVKNLTQANGGSVRLESEVNKGTTFYVMLPGDYSSEVSA